MPNGVPSSSKHLKSRRNLTPRAGHFGFSFDESILMGGRAGKNGGRCGISWAVALASLIPLRVKMVRSVRRAGLVLALGAVSPPGGCDQRTEKVVRADAPLPSGADGRRYLTVEEQSRIGRASIALWTGVDPRQDWKETVDRIFGACGGTLKLDEAFTVASYHPRTTYDWTWRSQVEALLLERGRWGWDPSSVPQCKLIRQALSAGTPTVDGAAP